eukprot:jgi/Botrbrau1/3990/Bobra.0016s0003.1
MNVAIYFFCGSGDGHRLTSRTHGLAKATRYAGFRPAIIEDQTVMVVGSAVLLDKSENAAGGDELRLGSSPEQKVQ